MTDYLHYWRVFLPLASLVFLIALWIVAECYWSRAARLGLGAVALLICIGLAFLTGSFLEHINSNLWFGRVTYELVNASVEELEQGRHEAVLNALKRLRSNYRVSYENRGKYDVLARDAVIEMKSRRSDEDAPRPPIR